MWEFLLNVWGFIFALGIILAIIVVLILVFVLVISWLLRETAKEWHDPKTRRGCGCMLWFAGFLLLGVFIAFMADLCG